MEGNVKNLLRVEYLTVLYRNIQTLKCERGIDCPNILIPVTYKINKYIQR